MKAILGRCGLKIRTAELKQCLGRHYDSLFRKLTVRYQPKIGPPQIVRTYRHEGSFTLLPRSLLGAFSKLITQLDCTLPRHDIAVELEAELFDNQVLVVNHLMSVFTPENVNAGRGYAILNMQAGLGKTFVAAGLIARLKLRTLYVVPKRPLASQALEDFRTALSCHVGVFHSKPKKTDPSTHYQNCDVCIITVDSAMLRDPEFYNHWSLVIFDEAHTLCTNRRKELFRKASARVMFGMSATTEDRNDGFDFIMHKELGSVIRAEEIPGFETLDVNFDMTVVVCKYFGPPEHTEELIHPSTGKLFTPYMNKQFIRDPHRMRLAVQKLRELYDWRDGEKQHSILVFCEELDALTQLFELFSADFDVEAPEISMKKFVGGLKSEVARDYAQTARVLLTTYGYSGTGLSIDRMTAMVFLTPRKSGMKQILARIRRRGGDQTIPRVVIDIVDKRTALQYQFRHRKLAYDYYDLGIEFESWNYEDL